MKTKRFALILLLILSILSGCSDSSQMKTLKIAVMGNPAEFHSGCKEGIERAVKDLNEEYSNSGYTVEYEFYSHDGNYEDGAAIIDALSKDKSITAVIGAVDMDINKTAAHVFNKADKLFVVPYFLYDSVYEDNNYDMVLSMCHSAETVGKTLRGAIAATTAKRWAICAAKNEFKNMEMNSFLQNSADDGIVVVDCADISVVANNFDDTYKLWEILGVEGVVMFPDNDEGFDVLKNIKQKNPNIICAGDTTFDDSVMLDQDPRLQAVMTGFIMIDAFAMNDETEAETKIIDEIADEYMQQTGNKLDTWYIQAYNAVRMIADTSIQNNTVNSADIAKLLHENGYTGLCQEFNFDENGAQITDVLKYNVFDSDGYTDEYILVK